MQVLIKGSSRRLGPRIAEDSEDTRKYCNTWWENSILKKRNFQGNLCDVNFSLIFLFVPLNTDFVFAENQIHQY